MGSDRDLGPQISIYRGWTIGWQSLFTWLLPGVLAVSLPFGYGWNLASQAYARYGPVAADYWSRPWYALAVTALLLFLLFSIYRLLLGRRFIAVHSGGLRLNLPHSRILPLVRTYQVDWEEVAGISTDWTSEQFFGIRLRTKQCALLHLSRRKTIYLGNWLQGLPELISQVKAQLFPRLLAEMKSSLQEGKQLNFGPLTVSSKCIQLHPQQPRNPFTRLASKPHEPVPWQNIQRMEARSGQLSVTISSPHSKKAESRICNIPIAQIPNLELLVHLVQQGVDQ